jgi:hypothetical protein
MISPSGEVEELRNLSPPRKRESGLLNHPSSREMMGCQKRAETRLVLNFQRQQRLDNRRGSWRLMHPKIGRPNASVPRKLLILRKTQKRAVRV